MPCDATLRRLTGYAAVALIVLLVLFLTGCGESAGTDAFTKASGDIGAVTTTLSADECNDLVDLDELGATDVNIAACSASYTSSLVAVCIEAEGALPDDTLDEVRAQTARDSSIVAVDAGDSGIELEQDGQWLGIYFSASAMMVVMTDDSHADDGHVFAQNAGFLDAPSVNRTTVVATLIAVVVIGALVAFILVNRSRKKAQIAAAFADSSVAQGQYPYPPDAPSTGQMMPQGAPVSPEQVNSPMWQAGHGMTDTQDTASQR